MKRLVMKQIFVKTTFLAFAAALIFNSCSKDAKCVDDVSDRGELVDFILAAGVEEVTPENQGTTKTVMNSDGITPNWSEGDQILILDASMKPVGDDGIFTLSEGEGTASAIFAGKKYSKQTVAYAIYPASAATVADNGTVVSGVMSADDGTISGAIMLGSSSDGTSVSFINACAVLKINTGNYSGTSSIKSIGVSALYNDTKAPLTGGFSIDWSTLSIAPDESLASTGITVLLPTSLIGTDKDVFIPIFPLEKKDDLAPSLQFRFVNSNDAPAELSYALTAAINPGVAKNLGRASSLSFEEPIPGSDKDYVLFEAETEHTLSLYETRDNHSSVKRMVYSYDLDTWHYLNLDMTVPFGGDVNPKVYIQGIEGTTIDGFKSPMIKIDNQQPGIADVKVSGNLIALISPEYYENDAVDLSASQVYAFYGLFKNCKVVSDVSDLRFPVTSVPSFCCKDMFYGCTGLASLSENLLPAVEVANNCYENMFYGCTGLTSLPSDLLPATTLADYCYSSMFYGCTGLTSLPSGLLPATTLADYCYSSMFYGCAGLTSTPALPATTLAQYCYSNMFSGCTGLTSTPALPATTLAQSCYSSMFSGCTGLTSLPSGLLPATTLAYSCCYRMFYGCTGLTALPETLLPATTLANYCYSSMFSGCTGLTSTPALPATTLANYCYSSMFGGCTGLTSTPALPATTLAQYCYSNMFSGCTGLTSTPALPATTLAQYCYSNMFSGCTGLTTLPETLLPATTLANYCYSSMFSGCTGLTSVPSVSALSFGYRCCASMFKNCTSLVDGPDIIPLYDDEGLCSYFTYCFDSMFSGCSKLRSVRMNLGFYDKDSADDIIRKVFENWLSGVSSTGTLYCPVGRASFFSELAPTGWTISDTLTP